MIEVWPPERSATIIRLDFLFAHSDGLPYRGIGTMTEGMTDATSANEDGMEIDKEKVDEFTLALLYLTTFKDKHGLRAWKSHDWDVLNRLHESGYIDDPVSKAKSVMLTDEGDGAVEASVRTAFCEIVREYENRQLGTLEQCCYPPKYKSGRGTALLANSRKNILSSMRNARLHIWLLTGGHFISALI
jgi:Domain of unknown function (DUF6429)